MISGPSASSQTMTSLLSDTVNQALQSANDTRDQWNSVIDGAKDWDLKKKAGLVDTKSGKTADTDYTSLSSSHKDSAATGTSGTITQDDLLKAYQMGASAKETTDSSAEAASNCPSQQAIYNAYLMGAQQAKADTKTEEDSKSLFGLKSLGHLVKGAIINPVTDLVKFASSGPLQFTGTLAAGALLLSPAGAALAPLGVALAAGTGVYHGLKFLGRLATTPDGAGRAEAFEDLGTALTSGLGAWKGALPALTGAKSVAEGLQASGAIQSAGALDTLGDLSKLDDFAALKQIPGALLPSTRNAAHLAAQPATWEAVGPRLSTFAQDAKTLPGKVQELAPQLPAKALGWKDQLADWLRTLGHANPANPATP